MRQIKSLSSLRAFESASRHLSFKSAAEELFVTPTAISHQIRALESELGCRLFERKTRQILLTREGHELFTVVHTAFDAVDEATARVSTHRTHDVVALGVGPIIGARWLAPRLGEFWSRFGDIDLRLHHSPLPIHHRIEEFDLAIAWGDGRWPNMEVEYLFEIQVTPVYAKTGHFAEARFDHASQILDFPLVHQRDHKDWKLWLKTAGVPLEDYLPGTVMEDANMVLQTALNGHGIALGIVQFIEDDIAGNRLTKPFDLAVDPGDAYYLIYRKTRVGRDAVKIVHDWIIEQAKPMASVI